MSNFALSCINQRKQRAQFFFHEGGTNSRFTPVCPYTKDSSGNLIYTPKDLDMRRKAEILKYIKPNNGNVSKNKYSQLATSTKKNNNKIICPNDYTPRPTTSSDVPGKIINLYEDPNAPLYNYYPISEQFKFQNIKYDDFKRLFDIFPDYNVNKTNGEYGCFTSIVILNPDANRFSFNFSIPISVNYSANYNNNEYQTTEGEIEEIDENGNITNVASGVNFKITNANMSIIESEMEILYGDSILQTIPGSYVSNPPSSSDLQQTLVTNSISFIGSSDGSVESTQYLGNIQFNNVILATISQYVYKINIKLKISYAEYTNIQSNNSVLPYRVNNNGDNIDNTNAKNLTNVVYNPILNILNSNIYISNDINCSTELFDIKGDIISPPYESLNITSTSLTS